ncbi:hypothetical protein LCGC14_1918790 [marine sediment metagenome]|uniref:Uncharacterized protein n=1 Tax=marine sediment metagenome TaxID=412755 RepID=A0A0F9GEQ8_9ZZZZ
MIDAYIKRLSKQSKVTAVYWASPVSDGAVNRFDDPKEIEVFWKGASSTDNDKTGREINSMDRVYVSEDLDQGGMLWQGALCDLTTAEKADPRTISNSYEIQLFWKTPSLSVVGQYQRKVILGGKVI